jgi:hypothetical protein
VPRGVCYNSGMSDAARKRHWFRFSLRTLFVAVTLAAMASAWIVARRSDLRDREITLLSDLPYETLGKLNSANVPPSGRSMPFRLRLLEI